MEPLGNIPSLTPHRQIIFFIQAPLASLLCQVAKPATVTGPSYDTVFTDKQGRVKVRFNLG